MNLLTGMNWLRALAALFVVIYHLNQHLPTSGFGYFGWGIHQFIWHLSIMVSVFFMLSWFFRSLSYWKNIDTPSSIPSFYISLKDRFFRIAPAYYVMLILSALATYYISGISGINYWIYFSHLAITWYTLPCSLEWSTLVYTTRYDRMDYDFIFYDGIIETQTNILYSIFYRNKYIDAWSTFFMDMTPLDSRWRY